MGKDRKLAAILFFFFYKVKIHVDFFLTMVSNLGVNPNKEENEDCFELVVKLLVANVSGNVRVWS